MSVFALRTRFAGRSSCMGAEPLGTADLLLAIYRGQSASASTQHALGRPSSSPTVIVPMMLVSHALMFMLLLRRS